MAGYALTRLGELDRIAEEIEEDLAQVPSVQDNQAS